MTTPLTTALPATTLTDVPPEEERVAHFSGSAERRAPVTWGQQAIWEAVRSTLPHDEWLNVRRVVPAPRRGNLTIDAAVDAIGMLISRHEALRTRLVIDNGLAVEQRVAAAGALPVTVVHTADEDPTARLVRLQSVRQVLQAPPAAAVTTDALAERLASLHFDYERDLPVRAGLVVGDGLVRNVVMVFSHVAVDWHAVEVVHRDLALLLARGRIDAPPTALTAVQLAERETADAARTRAAAAYWSDVYSRIPARQLPPLAPPDSPPAYEMVLTSTAAGPAAALVAGRHDVTTTTVFAAALAQGLSRVTGHPTVGLLTLLGNRHQDGHTGIIAPMSQLSIMAFDVADDLDTMLPGAWDASLAAYRHSYHEPRRLNEHLVALDRMHGGEIEPMCVFNDVRTGGDSTAPPDVDASAVARSTVTWSGLESLHWGCFFEVRNDVGTTVRLAMFAHTARLPRTTGEQLLRDVESTIVRTATAAG